jgi:hypothetical protein
VVILIEVLFIDWSRSVLYQERLSLLSITHSRVSISVLHQSPCSMPRFNMPRSRGREMGRRDAGRQILRSCYHFPSCQDILDVKNWLNKEGDWQEMPYEDGGTRQIVTVPDSYRCNDCPSLQLLPYRSAPSPSASDSVTDSRPMTPFIQPYRLPRGAHYLCYLSCG